MADKELSPGADARMADTPNPPDEEPPKEYQIAIYRDWCKACGICAAFCPRQCLSLDAEGYPVVDTSKKCAGCRWCELHCPDFAICVRELAEKGAAEEKED